jgi:glycosyltransferase involved in cell wall biosynthesis
MGTDRKKKLLLIIDSLSGGGAELVVANLCRHIDRRRFNVTVCGLKMLGERGEELQKTGYDVIELPPSRYRVERYLSSLRLGRIVRDKGIDLIHSHSTQGLVDGGILRFFNRRVRHVHTFHFGNYRHVSKKVLTLEKAFSRIPDKLVAVGKEQGKTIAKVFRLPNERIKTVWNGIEVHELGGNDGQKNGEINPDNGKIVLGSISTLIEQKGITYLLDAISLLGRRNKNFNLWIVGHGPLRDELRAKTSTLGLDGVVKFVGWVHNASAVILPKMDIFIQSSLWEAMSMVLLEAMAAGKPVVVTDVGDNRHVIENGKEGIIVPKMDPQKMAQEMERLILDKSLREELGQNARQKVTAECTVQAMARNYERLYLNVLGEGS